MVASKYILYTILCFYVPIINTISDKYGISRTISQDTRNINPIIDSSEIQIYSKRVNNNLTVYVEASERVIIVGMLSVLLYLYFVG